MIKRYGLMMLAIGLMAGLASRAEALTNKPRTIVGYAASNQSTDTLKTSVWVDYKGNCVAGLTPNKQAFDLSVNERKSGLIDVAACPNGSYVVFAEGTLPFNPSIGAGCHLDLPSSAGGFPVGKLNVNFAMDPAGTRTMCSITLQTLP